MNKTMVMVYNPDTDKFIYFDIKKDKRQNKL